MKTYIPGHCHVFFQSYLQHEETEEERISKDYLKEHLRISQKKILRVFDIFTLNGYLMANVI